MDKHPTRRLWLIGSLVLLVLTATACFQQAGTGPEPLPAAQGGPTCTPPPTDIPLLPTDTENPTLELATATQPPLETPIPPTEQSAVVEVPTLEPPTADLS